MAVSSWEDISTLYIFKLHHEDRERDSPPRLVVDLFKFKKSPWISFKEIQVGEILSSA